jgi:Peptidase_C39 like family
MKMRSLALFAVVLAAALFIGGCCKPEIAGNVPSTLRNQETNMWCWAATTQMLAQHFSITINQCNLANDVLGRTDCCNGQNSGSNCPRVNVCAEPGWVEIDRAGLKSKTTSTGLSWEDLRKQIYCAKKPMAYAYGGTGIGHVLIIKGYITVGNTNYVILNDPWSPCAGQERLITYAEYVDPSGSINHWETWYDVEKK